MRGATYELTTILGADIKDLQASLEAAGIPISREHQTEYLRRRSLTPQESMAEFEATVARFDALISPTNGEGLCRTCEKPPPRMWCWFGQPQGGCPLGMPPRWETDG